MLTLLFAIAATVQAPPPPPALRLSEAEDQAMRGVMKPWDAAKPIAGSPLVITVESLPVLDGVAAPIRLELRRRGVDAATTDSLIQSLLDRNPHPWSIESPSLAGATRLTFLDVLLKGMDARNANVRELANLGVVRAVAVPGTAGDSAIVFYGLGPQMTNTLFGNLHLAFVRRGVAMWDQQLDARFFVSDAGVPHQADFDADDARIVEEFLDHDFPDRGTKLFIVNETNRFSRGDLKLPADILQQLQARNKTELFLGALPLSRGVERIDPVQFWGKDPAPAGAAILLSLPGYSADHQRAAVTYTLVRRKGDAYERGFGFSLFNRTADGWRVVLDQFWANPTINADAPLRVGGDVTTPTVIKRDTPKFPSGAKGLIIMELVIDKNGAVKSAQ